MSAQRAPKDANTEPRGAVKHLPPAYFALVMASGIVSIAARDFDLPVLAAALFVLNLVAYAVLSALTVLRAIH
ncbi:SLAC1 family transporter [Metallibacterium sp.]